MGNPVTTGVRLYSLLILSTRLFGDKELLARQDGEAFDFNASQIFILSLKLNAEVVTREL